MDLVIDIETIPNSGMIDRLPEVEVKTGNLKDPEKIAEKIAEAKAEQIGKMALSPLWGRVCAWCGMEDEQTVWKECIREDSDDEETRILVTLFRAMTGKRIVTYNGNGFDLPFLYRRAVILGIDVREFGLPTLSDLCKRFSNSLHVDLMNVWAGFGNYEKLDNIAHVLLDDAKQEIDFRAFPELIQSEEGRRKLLDYCAQDVALTLRLWNRIAGILV